MAGIKWREEGERSSKFFLNAVTAKQASSTLDYLTTDQGIVNDIGQIVEHARVFINPYTLRKNVTQLITCISTVLVYEKRKKRN